MGVVVEECEGCKKIGNCCFTNRLTAEVRNDATFATFLQQGENIIRKKPDVLVTFSCGPRFS